MQKLTTLYLKIPRNTTVTPESAQNFLAALTQMTYVSFFQKLMGTQPQALSLEIGLINQQIRFMVTCENELIPFVDTQLSSNYPLIIIEKAKKDVFEENLPAGRQDLKVISLKLKAGNNYPISTYPAFKEIDPLSSILSILSRSESTDIAIIQYALEATTSHWQAKINNMLERGIKKSDGTYSSFPDQSIIKEKISYPGFKVSIRLASNSDKILKDLISSFGVFTRADANSFSAANESLFNNNKGFQNLVSRKVTGNQILNIAELATLWHLPNEKIQTLNIAWGISVLSEPPDNLPIAISTDNKSKKEINFFAKTTFKNKDSIFGIKARDRGHHIWVIGKTGTGKSTLISNMSIDDLKKDRGIAVIDPHGETCETLLNYIPSSRINDVIYFNPADKEYPIILNSLEVTNKEESELVVSGIVSIFNKIFGHSWGPRMEYILRNTLLTLTEVPNSTLSDVPTILTNKEFRHKIVEKLSDEVQKAFWTDEYEKMPLEFQKEAVSPILNKVGQFVTSPLIRRIIGSPKSSIQIDKIMNEKKILLVNLSQGRLGEDNSALLGAMLITKIQLAAMQRVAISESERSDFYLYVDEFQNFATTSFIKILSEARKYHLNLMLANQYMAQIPEEVQSAILGNVGSIISFAVGASDSSILHREFAETFSENDLVSLLRYQIAVKLMVDGHSARPFLANTLPLPVSSNKNREKVIRVSRERWARKI